MSHPSDPSELRAWYERRGVCTPPPYRRLFGTYDGPFAGWVVCECDDSGTEPRTPRAWPICRRCCACAPYPCRAYGPLEADARCSS